MNFSLQLRSYKKLNNTQAIRLRLSTSSKDSQYIDTKISVMKNQWDHKKQKIKRHPLEDKFNAILNALQIEIQSIYFKNKGVSAKRLLQVYIGLKGIDQESFLDFYQTKIDEMKLKNKIRSAKTYQNYYNQLKKYSSSLSFSDVDHNFMHSYDIHMLKKGNSVNTVSNNLRAIITVGNRAKEAGLIEVNKASGYKLNYKNVEKETLTLEEIQKIIDLELEDRYKSLIISKDLFLFCFYTAGMRFSDMSKLKWNNIVENEIVYTMSKSKERVGAVRRIPLNPKSIAILEKYKNKNSTFVFPVLYGFDNKKPEEIENRIMTKNNNYNVAIKNVAKRCGIDKKISMHVGKHSFADYAVKQDVNLLIISKLLGHSRLTTTQHYLKDFYQKEEGDAINKLFGGSLT
ncbi:site-specific recombinase [Tenacibaculum sp. Bg11-29]|uniref:tyrosine-type recombinase/integrase n=1 Tax=Tenacibaculum sp. Bg11-29 TaxID=2058306 RepID=UPI000C34B972|nr:site-specific integrase [Tenacibaculum sp. Bg11-29]PKH52452.1 site-specific recombinase [Tenacibaculum sp. Bg11-29]